MATRRWSSKVIWMRSGWSSGSICWVVLFWGRFAVSQTIIPEAQEHFLTPSAHRDTHPFGGSGFKINNALIYAHRPYFFFLSRFRAHSLACDPYPLSESTGSRSNRMGRWA